MVQTGRRLCLLDEAAHALCIGGDVGPQNLQRNGAVELSVAGKINLTRPARAKLALNSVTAQSCTAGQGHKYDFVE